MIQTTRKDARCCLRKSFKEIFYINQIKGERKIGWWWRENKFKAKKKIKDLEPAHKVRIKTIKKCEDGKRNWFRILKFEVLEMKKNVVTNNKPNFVFEKNN